MPVSAAPAPGAPCPGRAGGRRRTGPGAAKPERCRRPRSGGDGRADIGAEEHDLRHARAHQPALDEGGDHQGRRGGALQRDRGREARQEGTPGPVVPAASPVRNWAPKARETPCSPAPGEQEQRDGAGQIDHDDGGLHAPVLFDIRSPPQIARARPGVPIGRRPRPPARSTDPAPEEKVRERRRSASGARPEPKDRQGS